jgi:hypothetical protein
MAPGSFRSKKLKAIRKVKTCNADTALSEPKSMKRIAKEHEEALKRRRDILQGQSKTLCFTLLVADINLALPLDARSILSAIAQDSGAPPDSDLIIDEYMAEAGQWEDEPDEEEQDISHEGGEYTDSLRASFEQTVLAR